MTRKLVEFETQKTGGKLNERGTDTVSLLKPRLMCYNISGDENEEIRDNH